MKNFNINVDNLSTEEKQQLMTLINKANRGKRWRAKNDEIYYFINYCNKVESWSESNHKADKALFEAGNYFKTEEEAEFELNKRLVYQELKDYALEHNEEDNDWSDSKKCKWFITYSHSKFGGVFTDFHSDCQGLGQIYFNSQKIACDAIQSVGEDRIKKYLFDVN